MDCQGEPATASGQMGNPVVPPAS